MKLARRSFLIGAAALMVARPKIPTPSEPVYVGMDFALENDMTVVAMVDWHRNIVKAFHVPERLQRGRARR